VTVRYDNGMPQSVHTVVVAAQHDPDVKYEDLKEASSRKLSKKPFRPTCWWTPNSW